jgi:DNA polymerase-3 subunit gamma/tau
MEIRDGELQATLGAVAQEALLKFTAGLLARDSAGLLKQVDALLERGQDMRQFLSGVVEQLRNLIVVKITGDPGKIVELPVADIEAIRQQAASADAEQLLMLFDSLSKTLDDMRWSPHQRFTFEVGLIKACGLAPLKPLGEVLGKMRELEARLASGHLPAVNRVSERPAAYTPTPRASSAPPPPAAAGGGQHETWNRIMAVLRSRKPSLATFLEHSKLTSLSDTELVIGVKGNGFQTEQIQKQENLNLIEQAAGEVLNRKLIVKVQSVVVDSKPELTTKHQKKTKPEEVNPAVQDVLRVFTQGEVLEQDSPDEQ